jgi:hypothetical protein
MRKSLAVAAAVSVAIALMLLPDHASSKAGFKAGLGGFKVGFGKPAKVGFHKFHHGRRHAHRFHRHRGLGFGVPLLAAWGPALTEYREVTIEKAAEPPPPVEYKIYSAGSSGGCQIDVVRVPGIIGTTEVNVIRC